jgi:hypothetical protein
MIQFLGRAGEQRVSLWELFLRAYLPPDFHFSRQILFPACTGIRPRVGGVSDRSGVERANTAAENPLGSGLLRSRLAPDGPVGQDRRELFKHPLRVRFRNRFCDDPNYIYIATFLFEEVDSNDCQLCRFARKSTYMV